MKVQGYKILNWMQRKLHPATDYSRFSPKKSPAAFEEDTGESSAEAAEAPDAEALLLRHVLEGNILTIGTLGHPLVFLLPHSPEEVPSLESPPQEDPPAPPKPTSGPMARPLSQLENELFMKKGAEHSIDADEEKIMAEPLLKGDREMKERITLAELFAADPAASAKVATSLISGPSAKTIVDKEKKEGKKKKKGDEVGSPQNPAAVKKLQRMITKMVKKKIHPEAATAAKKAGGSAFYVTEDPLLRGGLGSGGGNGGGGGGNP